ncbi:hypothetical protein OQX61_02175 [Pedobacter sp. PLR]|uniref:hypothetical protein n=1 Tax=Pedobacter sp. PLR TaxID=2994465 RepID=UPI0022468F71|nr:hypothetical protein [Pedobacter sp. PLR]MCX2450066.1 hypothetical protein [Pedobacter sp. PLR]
MKTQDLDLLKDYGEFIAALSNAYNYRNIMGYLSKELHKKVCDSYSDLFAKYGDKDLSLLNRKAINQATAMLLTYFMFTGIPINMEPAFKKLEIEIIKSVYLS